MMRSINGSNHSRFQIKKAAITKSAPQNKMNEEKSKTNAMDKIIKR